MKCALCCNKTQMYTKLNLANSYKRKVALDRHPTEWFWNLSIHDHWLRVHSERCIVEFSCIYCKLSLIICSYLENKIYHKNWDLFPKRSCISAYIDPKNSDLESSTNSVLTEMKNLKLHTHTHVFVEQGNGLKFYLTCKHRSKCPVCVQWIHLRLVVMATNVQHVKGK